MIGLGEMLAREKDATEHWTLELDLRDTEEGHELGPGIAQAHVLCCQDRQSVYCLAKDLSRGVGVFTVAGLLAGVTRHYREVHTDGGGSPV